MVKQESSPKLSFSELYNLQEGVTGGAGDIVLTSSQEESFSFPPHPHPHLPTFHWSTVKMVLSHYTDVWAQ